MSCSRIADCESADGEVDEIEISGSLIESKLGRWDVVNWFGRDKGWWLSSEESRCSTRDGWC